MIDAALGTSLKNVYDGRLENVLRALRGMGSRYYFRLNSLARSSSEILDDMRTSGLNASRHERILDAGFFGVSEDSPSEDGVRVQADRFAAEAVMHGAHLYAPGVKDCKGLKAGMKASVLDSTGVVVGSGIARQGETAILRYHQGIAVETQNSRFRLPPLRETPWYSHGELHLQSLPSMVTCHVLDPKPGEVIVDLNCSPAGKMSYLCQLSKNRARVIGFDRNEQKVEKARGHLERLHCSNYQLIAHDSRYAHLDFSLKADKVLVDPPCSGLGVSPKLSLDTTLKDVNDLSAYQKQFLRAAESMVKKGGTIVYSVCTITCEECEKMVEFAENELGLVENEAEPMVASGRVNHSGSSQRFDPDLDGAGYFIAKFVKP